MTRSQPLKLIICFYGMGSSVKINPTTSNADFKINRTLRNIYESVRKITYFIFGKETKRVPNSEILQIFLLTVK
jgi:hypothetical protein